MITSITSRSRIRMVGLFLPLCLMVIFGAIGCGGHGRRLQGFGAWRGNRLYNTGNYAEAAGAYQERRPRRPARLPGATMAWPSAMTR